MIRSLQVTIGAGPTQVTTVRTPARQVIVSNSTTHTCRVGDSSTSATKGILLAAGASVSIGNTEAVNLDLQNFWVAGTAADLIDFLVVI